MNAGPLTAQSNVVVVHETVNGINLATNVVRARDSVEVLHGWVSHVVVTEDLLGLLDPVEGRSILLQNLGTRVLLLVWLVHIVNSDDGNVAVISEVAEGQASTWLSTDLLENVLVQVKADRHGEKVAVGETVVVDNAGSLSADLLPLCDLLDADTYPL